jgi:hypothetical protein
MKKTFEQWMKEVDEHLEDRCGMSSNDLPDVCYRDWYDDGIPPKRAAGMAFKSAQD